MTKKKLLGLAAAGAAATVAIYFVKRKKSKVSSEAKKAGNKLRRHVKSAFNDAKMNAGDKLAQA